MSSDTVPSSASLDVVRRLAQYRPFERGGATALEAQQDLLLAALAESGGTLDSIDECRARVAELFRIDLDSLEVARALEALREAGSILREASGVFRLHHTERARLEQLATESRNLEAEAFKEWRESLQHRWAEISDASLNRLEEDLRSYLRMVIRRHGAEGALLLYPDSPEARDLFEELERAGRRFLPPIEQGLSEIRDSALSDFMRRPTTSQSRLLAHSLNTGYFLTILSIDPECARLVREVAAGQRVYLDTNFIYRLLGIQGPRFVRPAELLLQRTLDAGYTCAVTPWTVAEFQASLARSREYLERHPVPPTEFAALAADATSEEDFVTAYWRRVRDQPGLTARDFMDLYSELEPHLDRLGIQVLDEGCDRIDRTPDRTAREVGVLEKVVHGRARGPEQLSHDVRHRRLVRQLRGTGHRTFSDFGAIFLTHDSVLPRYDYAARGRDSAEVPFCISAGSWFQVVEAFRPKSEDLEQALSDLLASPYVRYRETLSKDKAQAVAARLALYKDATPELAAKVFMNTATLPELEQTTTPEEQSAAIDEAILEAAREAQADAEAARQRAEDQIAAAEAARADAEERARLSARERDEQLAAAKAAGEEALRNEAARQERRVEAERDRAKAERDRADRERQNREEEVAEERRRSDRLRRRLRLVIFGIVSLGVFLVIALAADLDDAWAFIVGVGVILGLLAAVDSFLNRSSS